MNLREHLGILASLQAGEREKAALHMRQHLAAAMALHPAAG
ncbi:hypothetical protein [Roseomonas indoligenes]|nr:hypothetical protein [Pararoseomonas indoligenes]